jgi:hypothetical protein
MISDTPFPQLIFPEMVWKKMMAYAKFAVGEVSGLGALVHNKDSNNFVVLEVFLFEQVSSGAGTDLNTDEIAVFINHLIEQGKDPGVMKLWFHSHGTSDVFWSDKDYTNIQGLFHSDFMISIVVNKYEERLARLDIYQPIRLSLELPVVFKNDFLGVDLNKVRQEVGRKVKPSPLPRAAKIGAVRRR